MDTDVFEQFIEQLQRYVRERLIPAEKEILETETIPEAIVSEMRDMGLFGLTMLLMHRDGCLTRILFFYK